MKGYKAVINSRRQKVEIALIEFIQDTVITIVTVVAAMVIVWGGGADVNRKYFIRRSRQGESSD